MPQEKVRVYALARELDMESKDLLDLCRQANIDVRNQLSSLDPEQRDQIVELVRKGASAPAAAPARPVTPPPLPQGVKPIVNLNKPRPGRAETASPPPAGKPSAKAAAETRAAVPPETTVPPTPAEPTKKSVSTATAKAVEPPKQAPEAVTKPAEPPPAAEKPAAPPAPRTPEPPAPAEPPPAVKAETPTPPPAHPPVTHAAVQPVKPLAQPRPPEISRPAQAPPPPKAPETPRPAAATPPAPAPTPTPPPTLPGPPRPLPGGVPSLNRGRSIRDMGRGTGTPAGGRPATGSDTGGRPGTTPPRPLPSGAAPPPGQRSGLVPRPQPQQGGGRPGTTPPAKGTAPPSSAGPKKLDIPKELLMQPGFNPEKYLQELAKPAPPSGVVRPHGERSPVGFTPVPTAEEDEEEERKKGHGKKPGAIPGRKERHQERTARKERRSNIGLTLLDDEETSRRRARHPKVKVEKRPITQPRKGKVPISLPITVRSLSEAIGIKSGPLLMTLMSQGIMGVNINSVLDPDLAEAIALEQGCELEIKRAEDVEARIRAEREEEEAPENLQPRPPIVTVMGHVDHGKTSLLDYIRKSNVVATEAGGITQSLRAWRVRHNDRDITFLDTPGHEAFTKMRARGANVTDIAVIVVAANDGVMPQTEEAVSHAKAAGVAIIVAINKVDLPNANIKKVEQQLYGLDLIPDTMGGKVHFVHTSAVTGKGVDELLETISLVADYELELKANPNKPARGTCLEASVTEGEGVVATLLVQNGTLRRGDVILCGAAHGRVRAMYDDRGQLLNEAGPSMPVRITGLDIAPNADDQFQVVEDLATAREVAEKRLSRQQEAAVTVRGPVSLTSMTESKIVEVKIILKADVRGSVEAIKKELEKLQGHEEVRLRILHAGIGAVNESDVNLALTSPQDTLIVAFNVVADDRALALAEEKGIQIREYKIIYELTADVKAALEGKLKPREEVVHLGRAVVRELFKISRVGTIAGCRVTQGVIERNGLVRVIRGGVVIYPPADRTASLESLKRFKDDVREVQQGYECGLKIAGYDDIKVDDVIECYQIKEVKRTL